MEVKQSRLFPCNFFYPWGEPSISPSCTYGRRLGNLNWMPPTWAIHQAIHGQFYQAKMGKWWVIPLGNGGWFHCKNWGSYCKISNIASRSFKIWQQPAQSKPRESSRWKCPWFGSLRTHFSTLYTCVIMGVWIMNGIPTIMAITIPYTNGRMTISCNFWP
jgi:hypothetical protein